VATAGLHVPALKLTDTSLVMAMTVEQELRYVTQGRSFRPKAKNDPLTQRVVDRVKPIHDLIQRAMTGRKASNAKHDLPAYIVERVLVEDKDGPLGDLGPSILYTDQSLEIIEGLVDIAGVNFTYSDGESRGEAEQCVLENGTSDELVAKMLGLMRPFIVHHSIGVNRGRSLFGDYNGKGVPVTGNLMIARDELDPYAITSREVFDSLGLDLELEKRQVSVSSKTTSTGAPAILTAHTARIFVASIFVGTQAVSIGAGRIPTTTQYRGSDADLDVQKLYEAGNKWATELTSEFGVDAFTDKAKVLRSAPVLAALGTIGRPMYFEGKTSKQVMDASNLSKVDWSHATGGWDGIAGKRSPAGVFSVSSAKEAVHAVLAALTDPTNPGYAKIR